jgi:SEC-C motif domain protein
VSRRSARPIRTVDPAGACPCGLDRTYQDCCGSLHSGRATAPTAQALMRSRYGAFVVEDEAYLLRTWHATTRPPSIPFDPGQAWIGLVLLGTSGGSLLHTEGTVEFRASYRLRGRTATLHENSRFLRENGNWSYLGPTSSS